MTRRKPFNRRGFRIKALSPQERARLKTAHRFLRDAGEDRIFATKAAEVVIEAAMPHRARAPKGAPCKCIRCVIRRCLRADPTPYNQVLRETLEAHLRGPEAPPRALRTAWVCQGGVPRCGAENPPDAKACQKCERERPNRRINQARRRGFIGPQMPVKQCPTLGAREGDDPWSLRMRVPQKWPGHPAGYFDPTVLPDLKYAKLPKPGEGGE